MLKHPQVKIWGFYDFRKETKKRKWGITKSYNLYYEIIENRYGSLSLVPGTELKPL